MLRVALCSIALTSSASADQAFPPGDPQPPAPPAQSSLCIEGKPKSRCGANLLFEIGFGFGETTEPTEQDYRGSWIVPVQLGLSVNLTEKSAIGATAGLVAYQALETVEGRETSSFEGSFAAFVRYRRWLCSLCSIDVSIGGAESGPIVEVALQTADLIAITAGVHTFPVDDRTELAATVGLRFGGHLIAGLAQVFMKAK